VHVRIKAKHRGSLGRLFKNTSVDRELVLFVFIVVSLFTQSPCLSLKLAEHDEKRRVVEVLAPQIYP